MAKRYKYDFTRIEREVHAHLKKQQKAASHLDKSSRRNSGWTPRTVGTMDDGRTVTFRQGVGGNDGHTLIADGEKSGREFDRNHNHYGPKREGKGWVNGDRGHYSGPGH